MKQNIKSYEWDQKLDVYDVRLTSITRTKFHILKTEKEKKKQRNKRIESIFEKDLFYWLYYYILLISEFWQKMKNKRKSLTGNRIWSKTFNSPGSYCLQNKKKKRCDSINGAGIHNTKRKEKIKNNWQ